MTWQLKGDNQRVLSVGAPIHVYQIQFIPTQTQLLSYCRPSPGQAAAGQSCCLFNGYHDALVGSMREHLSATNILYRTYRDFQRVTIMKNNKPALPFRGCSSNLLVVSDSTRRPPLILLFLRIPEHKTITYTTLVCFLAIQQCQTCAPPMGWHRLGHQSRWIREIDLPCNVCIRPTAVFPTTPDLLSKPEQYHSHYNLRTRHPYVFGSSSCYC